MLKVYQGVSMCFGLSTAGSKMFWAVRRSCWTSPFVAIGQAMAGSGQARLDVPASHVASWQSDYDWSRNCRRWCLWHFTQNKHDRMPENYDNGMMLVLKRLVEFQCNSHSSGCGPLIFEPTRDCCSQFATSRAAWQNFTQEPAGLSRFFHLLFE